MTNGVSLDLGLVAGNPPNGIVARLSLQSGLVDGVDHVHVLLEKSRGRVHFETTTAAWHGVTRVPQYNSIKWASESAVALIGGGAAVL